MTDSSLTYFPDSLEAAASALVVILTDARVTKADYRFGGLSAQQILSSGLQLEGDLTEISAKLDQVTGLVRHED